MDTSDCIPFTAGTPAPEAFQLDVLREMTNAAIDKHGATCFAYGTTFGEKSFREAIVKHYLSGKWLGDTDPDDIVVTTGSTQGFDLMWKTLVTPRRHRPDRGDHLRRHDKLPDDGRAASRRRQV